MAPDYGWDISLKNEQVKWEVLRENVQNYIKATNFGYVSKMREVGADYIEAKASLGPSNQVEFNFDGKDYKLKAKNIVVATGGRPRYLPNTIEGFKFEKEAITSDDLFALDKSPGKTLVVGGGYIAIECAGFIKELGHEVIMINRSSFLRVFDQTVAGKIMENMTGGGLKAFGKASISHVTKEENGQYLVKLKIDGEEKMARVDSILFAIGRDPNTSIVQTKDVRINPNTMKIEGRKEEPERTSVDNIYAIGDLLEGVPELMPVAQKSGKLLAHRIHHRIKGDISEEEILDKYSMDYTYIPTTVFSNVEYSFVGLTEEEAVEKYGEDNIEVYQRETTPLENSIYSKNDKTAYMKLICERTSDEKVIGIHYLGPSAGEVIGGFALAMKLGLTKKQLDKTLGIHPTVSEDLFNMEITKRSGKDYVKTDC